MISKISYINQKDKKIEENNKEIKLIKSEYEISLHKFNECEKNYINLETKLKEEIKFQKNEYDNMKSNLNFTVENLEKENFNVKLFSFYL